MADQIAIEVGLAPWKPAPDAELIKTYNYYDVPLIGVLRQGRTDHLFWCLEGHVEPVSVWVYTRVENSDVAALEKAGDINETLRGLMGNRSVVVALAKEGEGIVAAGLIRNSGEFKNVVEAALAANDDFGRELQQLQIG